MSQPLLTRSFLKTKSLSGEGISPETVFGLPEKVLQFGTGGLLRGLPDYFIDKANRAGLFNGRIVVVKSTPGDAPGAFFAQDSLYTVCLRGRSGADLREEDIVNTSISRVLAAHSEWPAILATADNPELTLVISNTTEVGISRVDEPLGALPPVSFPGKLLGWLERRFRTFRGDPERGLVIIPTELIPDNGDTLRAVVRELALARGTGEDFLRWLETANHFCNSLVDCIVPGALPEAEKLIKQNALGYRDDLMIVTELYRLWAIEARHPAVNLACSFARSDDRVVLATDISPYRERKLRLLNGPHTFACGLAQAAGFTLVREAMADARFLRFLDTLMLQEIVPVLASGTVPAASAREFAADVADRFANPFIDHRWKDIALQFTTKMRMRNVPLILDHYRLFGKPPGAMSLGFAGYLWYMRPRAEASLPDDRAADLARHWGTKETAAVVRSVLSDVSLWGTDLSALPGFSAAVAGQLDMLLTRGGREALAVFSSLIPET